MLFRALSCALVGMAAVGVAKPNVVILFVDDWYVCYAPRRLLSRHAVCICCCCACNATICRSRGLVAWGMGTVRVSVGLGLGLR